MKGGGWTWVVLLGAAGCLSPPPEPAPRRLLQAPSVARLLAAGRVALRAGRLDVAQARFTAALRLDDRCIPAHRYLQALWERRARLGTALLEYRQRFERAPTPLNRYLYGRLLQDPFRQLRFLSAALQEDPSLGWAFLDRAVLRERLGDVAGARDDLDRAYRLLGSEPEVLYRRGLFFFRQGEPHRALDALLGALRADPHLAPALFALYRVHAAFGAHGAALESLRSAVAEAPEEETILAAVRKEAAHHASPQVLQDWARLLAAATTAGGAPNPEVEHTLGVLALYSQRLQRALIHLRRAARAGADPARVVPDLVRACVLTGRYAEAWRWFLTYAPEKLLFAPENALRERWAEVAAATAAAEGAGDLRRLARAYAQVGWLAEAREVYDRLAAEGGEDEQVRAAREEVEELLALVGSLGEYFRNHYRRAFRGRSRSLKEVAADVLVRARPLCGDRPLPPLPWRHYAFLGTVLDQERFAAHPLGRLFARYNYFFLLGRRWGGVPEGLLARRLVWVPAARRPRFGRTVPHGYTVGYAVAVPSLQERRGERLGGVTYGRAYFVNFDFVHHWRHEVLRIHRRFATSLGAVDLFHDAALPAATAAEALDLGLPLNLRERLAYLFVAEAGVEGPGIQPFLDAIRTHEEGHVLDAARYLPPALHPLRILSLLWQGGFSARGVEAWLEGNAELTALAEGKAPRLSLLQLVGFLPMAGPSPHAAGYRAVVQALVEELWRARKTWPALDRRRNLLQQLHVLSPEDLRRLARRVARRRGLGG